MATHHETPSPSIALTKTVTVYPKTPYPQKVLELSNLDRQCPLHMYLVFFYNQSTSYKNLSPDSVFNRLKTGLEETLAVWYPVAGRLRLNSTDGKLNLWCNNGGATLVEAITKVKMSELGDLSQYNEFFEKLVYKPVLNGNFSEFPLLVAQVTKFGCGGYSIGTGISHSLFDGPAAFDFLTAWASNSNSSSSSIVKENKVQKPVHERGIVLMNKFQNPNSGGKKAAAIDHLYQLIMQANDQIILSQTQTQTQNKYVYRTFHLTRMMIESLKKKAFGENGAFHCSSFDIIAAHLWKARTKALCVSNEKMVCLQFAVDSRNKTVPPLPRGFSGNAFVLASVNITAKQLEEENHKTIVEMIRNAKSCVDNDYITAYKQALEGPPQASLPPLKELTVVSDWTRMPFHKIEFLHGQGEAAYASPLAPPILEVAYFLQNPADHQAIDVRVSLLSQTFDAFSHHFSTGMQ